MITKHWSTPIYYQEALGWKQHIPELRTALLSQYAMAENKILDGSKHNVWDWDLPSVRWLRNSLTLAAVEYLQYFDVKIENPGSFWGRSWGNVLQSGGGPTHQILHAHHEADFFAVLVVDEGASDESGGQLSLLDPRFANNTHLLNREGRINFQPHTGWIFIAPGYVWHEVLPYNKSEPRITIASNFQYSLMKIRD